LTFQVGGVPDESLQHATLAKFGIRKMPSSGDIPLHGVTYWVSLQTIKKNAWKAELFDSPHLPRTESYFVITESGIEDYKGKIGKD